MRTPTISRIKVEANLSFPAECLEKNSDTLENVMESLIDFTSHLILKF